eukprot:scaffold83316_cov17-Tisochrysis_lutea.AAC.1
MQPYAAKGQKTLTDMICAKQKRKEGDGLPRSSALRGHRLGAFSWQGGGRHHAVAWLTAGSNSCSKDSRVGLAAAVAGGAWRPWFERARENTSKVYEDEVPLGTTDEAREG